MTTTWALQSDDRHEHNERLVSTLGEQDLFTFHARHMSNPLLSILVGLLFLLILQSASAAVVSYRLFR